MTPVGDLIERVARAICAVAKGPEYADVECYGETGERWRPWWHVFIPEARAAIAAMREPTEAMVTAGAPFAMMAEGDEAGLCYQAMIDKALKP